MVWRGAKRDGREHVIPDALVFFGPTVEDAVSFSEVLASYDEYFTFVRSAETSWIARRVEHLEHVAVFLSVATRLDPKIAAWWC